MGLFYGSSKKFYLATICCLIAILLIGAYMEIICSEKTHGYGVGASFGAGVAIILLLIQQSSEHFKISEERKETLGYIMYGWYGLGVISYWIIITEINKKGTSTEQSLALVAVVLFIVSLLLLICANYKKKSHTDMAIINNEITSRQRKRDDRRQSKEEAKTARQEQKLNEAAHKFLERHSWLNDYPDAVLDVDNKSCTIKALNSEAEIKKLEAIGQCFYSVSYWEMKEQWVSEQREYKGSTGYQIHDDGHVTSYNYGGGSYTHKEKKMVDTPMEQVFTDLSEAVSYYRRDLRKKSFSVTVDGVRVNTGL